MDSSDIRALSQSLGDGATRLESQARALVRGMTIELASRISGAAPVDTGFLRSSVDYTMSNDRLTGIVGPTAHYAIYLENGTRFMSERPFVNPSADQTEERFYAGMEQIAARILG